MTYKLEFTEQQMEILNAAISELPFKHAAPLVNSINAQLVKQRDDEEAANVAAAIAAAKAVKGDDAKHELVE